MKATMTKAKQFIQNYKRDYSNVNVGWNDNGEEVTWYSPWLSPDDALRAVEIEREEMIEKACSWLSNMSIEDMEYKYDGFDTSEGWYRMIEDFRNYMEK